MNLILYFILKFVVTILITRPIYFLQQMTWVMWNVCAQTGFIQSFNHQVWNKLIKSLFFFRTTVSSNSAVPRNLSREKAKLQILFDSILFSIPFAMERNQLVKLLNNVWQDFSQSREPYNSQQIYQFFLTVCHLSQCIGVCVRLCYYFMFIVLHSISNR